MNFILFLHRELVEKKNYNKFLKAFNKGKNMKDFSIENYSKDRTKGVLLLHKNKQIFKSKLFFFLLFYFLLCK